MKDSLETKIAWCQLGAWLIILTYGDSQVLIHPQQTLLWSLHPSARATCDTCCQVSSVISTVGWKTCIKVAVNRHFESWKQLVLWKVICSECNQFGGYYMWYWSRNIDTDKWQCIWKSIWKYFKMSNTLGKYLNTNTFSINVKYNYKYF